MMGKVVFLPLVECNSVAALGRVSLSLLVDESTKEK